MRDRLKAILDAYVDRLRGDMDRGSPVPGMWIFRQGIDHEAPLRAVEVLLAEARETGRREGAAALAEQMDYQCACRCRAHRKAICVKCNDVFGCPVHSEVDPSVLRPEFLKDPEAVAQAIFETHKETAAEEGAIVVGYSWEESSQNYRRAMVEAVRRVVTVRFEARK